MVQIDCPYKILVSIFKYNTGTNMEYNISMDSYFRVERNSNNNREGYTKVRSQLKELGRSTILNFQKTQFWNNHITTREKMHQYVSCLFLSDVRYHKYKIRLVPFLGQHYQARLSVHSHFFQKLGIRSAILFQNLGIYSSKLGIYSDIPGHVTMS